VWSVFGLEFHNSFQPVIIGEITSSYRGTAVEVRLRPHLLVSCFVGLWLTGIWSISALMAFALLTGRANASSTEAQAASWLALLVLAVGAPLAMWSSFWSEAKKAKRILSEAVESRSIDA